MAKLYSEHNTLPYRAQQIYHILAYMVAPRKATITYGELADMLGYGGAGILGRQLGYVAAWCYAEELPYLTSIVVNEKTGKCGEGYPGDDAEADRRKVYATKWYDCLPPSRAALTEAYEVHGPALWGE